MKLRRIAKALLFSIGLGLAATSSSSVAEKDRPQAVYFNGNKYRAERCSFASRGADGWCISDSKSNYVTNKELYGKLAFMAEVQRDTRSLQPAIKDSIEAFDRAFDVQAVAKAAKFVNDVGSSIETSLIQRIIGGALIESKEDQYQIVKDIFKDQQKEIYSMYSDKLKEKFGENFSQRVLDGDVSEKEIKDILKNISDECYEYQLKLASNELKRADKLISKKNKTPDEIDLSWKLTTNGISRGYMAAKAINILNEPNTLENSVNSIWYKLGKGAGVDSIVDLDFLVEDPDFAKAIKESQEEFYKYQNKFDEFKDAYDVNKPNSSASKIFEIETKRQEVKDKTVNKTNSKQEPYFVSLAPKQNVVHPKKNIQKPKTQEPKKEIEKQEVRENKDKRDLENLIKLYTCTSKNFVYPYDESTFETYWNSFYTEKPAFDDYWFLFSRKKRQELEEKYGPNAQSIVRNCFNRETYDLEIKELIIKNPYDHTSSAKISYKFKDGELRNETIIFFKEGQDQIWRVAEIEKVNMNVQPAPQQNTNQVHNRKVDFNLFCGPNAQFGGMFHYSGKRVCNNKTYHCYNDINDFKSKVRYGELGMCGNVFGYEITVDGNMIESTVHVDKSTHHITMNNIPIDQLPGLLDRIESIRKGEQ